MGGARPMTVRRFTRLDENARHAVTGRALTVASGVNGYWLDRRATPAPTPPTVRA